jgi:hypothetical protein
MLSHFSGTDHGTKEQDCNSIVYGEQERSAEWITTEVIQTTNSPQRLQRTDITSIYLHDVRLTLLTQTGLLMIKQLRLQHLPILITNITRKLWKLFQVLNPIHSRQNSVDGGSARRKAATYTQNTHRHPCLEWDSNTRSQRSSERRQLHDLIHITVKLKWPFLFLGILGDSHSKVTCGSRKSYGT